jgi:hypothetical protein
VAVHVYDLLPGDEVTNGPMSAVHIDHLPHPYWRDLQLVIWRLADGTISLDALDIRQEVGELTPARWDERRERLRRALTPGALP